MHPGLSDPIRDLKFHPRMYYFTPSVPSNDIETPAHDENVGGLALQSHTVVVKRKCMIPCIAAENPTRPTFKAAGVLQLDQLPSNPRALTHFREPTLHSKSFILQCDIPKNPFHDDHSRRRQDEAGQNWLHHLQVSTLQQRSMLID